MNGMSEKSHLPMRDFSGVKSACKALLKAFYMHNTLRANCISWFDPNYGMTNYGLVL